MDDVPLANRIALGLAGVVLVAAVAVLGLQAAFGAYSDDYELRAVFPRSGQGLDATSTVKLRGVTVGSVESIELLPDGRAEVVLSIERGVSIPVTASASAEPLSLFGPKYIRIDPGAGELGGEVLRPGATIERTSTAPEVIDLLDGTAAVLATIDPAGLATIIGNLAEGLDGLGPRLGGTLDAAAEVVALLHERRAALSTLLADVAALATELGRRGDDITAIAGDVHGGLAALAAGEDGLARILAATSQMAFELGDLVRRHAGDLDRTLAGVGPAVDALFAQLACIPGFLEANVGLMDLLGAELLTYELPGGRVAAVVSGPADLASLLAPIPEPVAPPIARCTG